MKDYKLVINTRNKKYPIYIGHNILKTSNKIFRNNKLDIKKCLVVVDKIVPRKNILILKKNIKSKKFFIYYFKFNEKNKSLNYVNSILTILFKHNFNREDYIFALGGGITGDLVGFVASIFKRGIKFINTNNLIISSWLLYRW